MINIICWGNLVLLPTHSTGSKKNVWFVRFKSESSSNHVQVFFQRGPAISKCFLWALSLTDRWNKSSGFGKHSIWPVTLFQRNRKYIQWRNYFCPFHFFHSWYDSTDYKFNIYNNHNANDDIPVEIIRGVIISVSQSLWTSRSNQWLTWLILSNGPHRSVKDLFQMLLRWQRPRPHVSRYF